MAYQPIQSVAVGLLSLAHVAVTRPLLATTVGLSVSVKDGGGDDAATLNWLLVAANVQPLFR